MIYTQDTNFRKVKRTVYTLIVLSIITFLSGFLKYTPFEHSTIILIFLLFVGGVSLIHMASKIDVNRYLKFFLIITGISTIVFMLLVVIAVVKSMLSGMTLSDTLESLEGAFYLNSLLFLTGVIGSIVLFMRKGSRNSSKVKSIPTKNKNTFANQVGSSAHNK